MLDFTGQSTWLSSWILLHLLLDQLHDKVKFLDIWLGLFIWLLLLNCLFNHLKNLVLLVILVISCCVDDLHETNKEHLYELLLLISHVASVELHEFTESLHVQNLFLILTLVILLFLHIFLTQIQVIWVHHWGVVRPLARDRFWVGVVSLSFLHRDCILFIAKWFSFVITMQFKLYTFFNIIHRIFGIHYYWSQRSISLLRVHSRRRHQILLVLKIILSIESCFAGFHFDWSVEFLSTSIVLWYYLLLIAHSLLYIWNGFYCPLRNHRNFLGAVRRNYFFLCHKVAGKRGNLSLVSFHSALLILFDWRLFLAFFLDLVRTILISSWSLTVIFFIVLIFVNLPPANFLVLALRTLNLAFFTYIIIWIIFSLILCVEDVH